MTEERAIKCPHTSYSTCSVCYDFALLRDLLTQTLCTPDDRPEKLKKLRRIETEVNRLNKRYGTIPP